MDLLRQYFLEECRELHDNNVRIRIIGRQDRLDEDIVRQFHEAITLTQDNDGLQLTLAVDYSGQNDIFTAAKAFGAASSRDSSLPAESDFEAHLMTRDLPPVDMMIRTGGERRLSNFLLWQSAYTELWFTSTLWPDFNPHHLATAVADYRERERRYGGVGRLNAASSSPINWRRWVSGIVMTGLASYALVHANTWYFTALVALVAGLAVSEWVRLTHNSGALLASACGSVTLAMVLMKTYGGEVAMMVILGTAVLAVMGCHVKKRGLDAFLPGVGIGYIGLAGLALMYMHTRWGAWLVLWIVAVVVATDVGAYLGGRTMGGRRLAPIISPAKTWSGLFAGVVTAVGASLAVPHLNATFAQWHDRHMVWATGLAIILALLSQGGDLLESWLKRRQGVKDSGNLIPGHGGVLDRVDGLLTAAVVGFAAFMVWANTLGLSALG